MKVFITGASGYIGTAVAERLRDAGHETYGLARSDAAAAKLDAAGVVPVRGDLTRPDTLTEPARASDAVMNLATTYDAKVDGPAIEALLRGLEGSGKPFIYTSGIWSHGDTHGRVVDESTPPEPVELVAWRVGVEQRVLDAARHGVRSVVIRPSVVYGRGGGIPGEWAQSARSLGAARYVGTGRNRWPAVHVDDLADLYLLALERAPAGTLLLAVNDDEAHTIAELAAAASRGAGAGGRTESWPLEEARTKLGAYADALVVDQLASARRAKQLLGWQPSGPGILEELESGSYTRAAATASR
jgi:nucleoside-diphosphate-sugar epimerase